MSKLKIKLDNYKKFFCSEYGLKLMIEIIEKDDYEAVKGIAKWEKCPSRVLDKIAIKYMTGKEFKIHINLEVLEEVVDNPKISVKTLKEISNFVIGCLDEHREQAYGVLEEIAESKKLTAELAETLYKVALENDLNDVIDKLAENKNTPDNILYNILDRFDDETIVYRDASEEIIRRYKKLKEQLAKEKDE